MGDFTEHVVFGLLASSIVLYFLEPYFFFSKLEAFATSLAVIIGSVLPDVDHKNAYAHRGAKVFVSAGAAIATVLYLPLPFYFRMALSAATFTFTYVVFGSVRMKHRGFTHSISFAVIATSATVIAGVFIISTPFPGIALMIGAMSHLLLDREFKLV